MKGVVILVVFLFLLISPIKASEPYKGYRGYVDFSFGEAFNPSTARISTNNMQLFSEISSTHGYRLKNWFVGGGIGYYHSFRDKENMYPIYVAGKYTIEDVRTKPYFETRAGIVYDPRWVSTVQAYGGLGAGMKLYKQIQIGLKLSIFSRPSRSFTANASIALSYSFGK